MLPGGDISREDAGSLQSPLPRFLVDTIPQMRIRSQHGTDSQGLLHEELLPYKDDCQLAGNSLH